MAKRELGKTGPLVFAISLIFTLASCQRGEMRSSRTLYTYNDIVIDTTGILIATFENGDIALGTPCAFVNLKGDTIIPRDRYSHCWTDTLKNFAIVFDEVNTDARVVAIDRNENILFEVVLFDNWPDELSEGVFRIRRNELVGYANEYGVVVIPCQYKCALRFNEGMAKVAFECIEYDGDEHRSPESDEWFYIDKFGNRVDTSKE